MDDDEKLRTLVERAWANYDPDFNPLTQIQWRKLADALLSLREENARLRDRLKLWEPPLTSTVGGR